MRRTRLPLVGLALGVCLGLTMTAAFADAGAAQLTLVQQTRVSLAPGVDHLTLVETNPANVIHVGRVLAHAPTVIKAVPAPANSQGTTLATATDLCATAYALLCVNGDFYGPGGTPIGGEVVDGRWLRQPNGTEQQLWLDKSNRFSLGAMPAGVVQSLGATSYPIVVNGRVGPIREHDVFSDSAQARTLVGWNGAGDSFFVTIDKGRSSRGVTLTEAGNLMVQLGATNAVNEDGGGSSQFVVGSSVANTPVFGPREVANAWAVVALPSAAGSSAPFAPFVASRPPTRR